MPACRQGINVSFLQRTASNAEIGGAAVGGAPSGRPASYTQQLAALGTSGKHPQNAERDLLRLTEGRTQRKFPIDWANSNRRTRDGLAEPYRHPVLLPHELMATLHGVSEAKFAETFGLRGVRCLKLRHGR